MSREDMAFMKSYLDKADRLFKLLITAIALLELALLIRGLLFFDLERLKLRLYVYSYGFLFGTSLAARILFALFRSREAHFGKAVAIVYIYAFCFMMWSAGVTCIDCYANGDSGIIVYVITCISVGVLTLLKPWVFLGYLAVSSIFLLMVTAAMRGWVPYSTGFYLNFGVFLVMAICINGHNYSLSLREYRARKTLEQHSQTDPLTGLYNRRKLDEQMQGLRLPAVLVILDMDDFKKINDCLGHTTGDECLERVAKLLKLHFGEQVYRMGGDEFVILSPLSVEETGSRIDAVNRELEENREQLALRISAGLYPLRKGDVPKEALRKADNALYQAKSAGGSCWAVYEG